MHRLPEEIYRVETVRRIDRLAIEQCGIAGYELMCRAGAAALREIMQAWPDSRRWQILCGGGNNGGDGYVLARLAGQAGIEVFVRSLADPARLKGDAATAFEECRAAGLDVQPWSGQIDERADLVVDAMLGSGLSRELDGAFAEAVERVNRQSRPVIALDIPTGLDADSGLQLGTAIRADMTLCFVGLKTGLFLADGVACRGRLSFDDLAIPAECRAGAEVIMRGIDDAELRRCLPPRGNDAHKGQYGRVLVIGGGIGMPGAARLCGEAALRSGAGRVSVATDPAHAVQISSARPELMTHAVAGGAALRPLLDKADVIAFGPGLGQTAWAHELYDEVLACERPTVWDADALNLLAAAGTSAPAATRAARRIITPHPGEAASLLGCTGGSIQRDRLGALRALEERSGSVVVLKGANTLISGDAGIPRVSYSGNPGMATAGMGDVLTGIIAGLLAQGLTLHDAAMIGVEVHARAGDLAAANGQRGVIATDILDCLRGPVNPGGRNQGSGAGSDRHLS